MRRRSEHSAVDGGFTLIELAIVILIIGLLLLMAIPSFLRVQRGAHNRAAQSSLRAVLGASAAFYDDDTGYADVPAQLMAGNFEMQFIVVGESTGPRVVRGAFTTDMLNAVAYSRTGRCYEIEQTADTQRFGSFLVTPTTPCEPGHSTAWSTNEW